MSDLIFAQISELFKDMIEKILLEEREKYLMEHKQTRANGYYKRTPKTIFGEMELKIPRTRDGEFKSCLLPSRKRACFMLEEVVEAMFIAGVSTRKTGEVIKNLIGTSISHQYVSRLIDISEEVIEEWKNRKLEDEYPVLYIDATYVALKRDTVSKEAVYVVMGLKEDGKREILAYFLPGGNEKAGVWKEIFQNLKDRGLRGVRMIISDDLTGLSDVIKEEFPESLHQLCWFHLKKNIRNKVRKSHWDRMLRDLEEVINSKDINEGKERFRLFIEKWGKIYRFLNNLERKKENYTYFLLAPKNVRSYFRTTNWMERCFKELKDYIRVRGFFQNEESAEKFLYLFFKDKHSRLMSRRLRFSSDINRFFSLLKGDVSHA